MPLAMALRVLGRSPAPMSRIARLFRERRWSACLNLVEAAVAAVPAGERPAAELLGYRVRLLGFHLGRRQEGLAAARRAVDLYPEEAAPWADLARLAVEAGDPVTALRAYRQAARQGHDRDEVTRELFRIVMRRKRFGAARRLVPALGRAPGEDSAVDALRCELALIDKDPAACLALLDALGPKDAAKRKFQGQRKMAASMAAELAAGDTMAGIRHIAICGVSYVGSTLFGLILGSVRGVTFAGETHWLTDIGTTTEDAPSAVHDPRVARDDWAVCRVCGADCQVFTPEFRLALSRDRVGYYGNIARRLGTATLVTSDRNFGHYWKNDPLLRYERVILYKSPHEQVRSFLKQNARKLGEEVARAKALGSVDRWLDAWVGNYLAALKAPTSVARRLVIHWEGLVASPQAHLDRALKHLGLAAGPELLEDIRAKHYVGGNSVGVMAWREGRIEMRPSDAPPLTAALIDKIAAHREAAFVHGLLETEYRRQFPEAGEARRQAIARDEIP